MNMYTFITMHDVIVKELDNKKDLPIVLLIFSIYKSIQYDIVN